MIAMVMNRATVAAESEGCAATAWTHISTLMGNTTAPKKKKVKPLKTASVRKI